MALIAPLNFYFENFSTLRNFKRMVELMQTDHQNFHTSFLCNFLF